MFFGRDRLRAKEGVTCIRESNHHRHKISSLTGTSLVGSTVRSLGSWFCTWTQEHLPYRVTSTRPSSLPHRYLIAISS